MAIDVTEVRARIRSEALKEIGYTEGRRNHNKFATELGASWVQNAPWCGTFVTAIYARAGVNLTKVISNPYYVPTLIREAKAKGVFIRTNPRDGDVVMFDWQGQEWNGDHTGIAIPSRGARHSVEGNTSPTSAGSQGNGGGVWERTRRAPQIVGYISLALVAQRIPGAFGEPEPPRVWLTSPRIKSMTAAQVKALQKDLQTLGYDLGKWGADGKYGQATTEAVLSAQKAAGVVADGVAGPETLRALSKALRGATAAKPKPAAKPKTTPKGRAIDVDGYWGKDVNKSLQIALGVKYRDGLLSRQPRNQVTEAMTAGSILFTGPGDDGSDTVRALQKLVGSKQDGRLGVNTYKAVQRFLKKRGHYTGPIDGRLDRPSNGVKGLQRYLNDETK